MANDTASDLNLNLAGYTALKGRVEALDHQLVTHHVRDEDGNEYTALYVLNPATHELVVIDAGSEKSCDFEVEGWCKQREKAAAAPIDEDEDEDADPREPRDWVLMRGADLTDVIFAVKALGEAIENAPTTDTIVGLAGAVQVVGSRLQSASDHGKDQDAFYRRVAKTLVEWAR